MCIFDITIKGKNSNSFKIPKIRPIFRMFLAKVIISDYIDQHNIDTECRSKHTTGTKVCKKIVAT